MILLPMLLEHGWILWRSSSFQHFGSGVTFMYYEDLEFTVEGMKQSQNVIGFDLILD